MTNFILSIFSTEKMSKEMCCRAIQVSCKLLKGGGERRSELALRGLLRGELTLNRRVKIEIDRTF